MVAAGSVSFLVHVRVFFALSVAGISSVYCATKDYGDLRNLIDNHTKTHFAAPAYNSLHEWSERKAGLKRQILAAAGLSPFPVRTSLNAQRFHRINHKRFTVETVAIETLPGFHLFGNLYLPPRDGKRHAAVLVLHGHWKHGRVEDKKDYSVPALCANLAAQGYVVFTHDMLGYNDTRQLPHEFGITPREQLWSFNPLGIQLWNSIRALDFLVSLEEVDAEKIGVTGASGGGTQTLLVAAVDERVKAAAPVVMVSSVFQGDDVCEMAPGLRVNANNMEIAALMAPRPMILVSSTRDWTKNTPKVEYPGIQGIYKLYGAADRLEFASVDAKHNYNQESRKQVYRFLDQLLRGNSDFRGWTELNGPKLPTNELLAGFKAQIQNSLATLFDQWRQASRCQAADLNEQDWISQTEANLGLEWPAHVSAVNAGEVILLQRDDSGERVPVTWSPGNSNEIVVAVDHKGSAHAKSHEDQRMLDSDTLFVDVFQTGLAETPRPPARKDFLTFHRSDDGNRVQDILTALSYTSARRPARIRLTCSPRAAAWCALAAALAPIHVALDSDTQIENTEEYLLRNLFIPGIERAGGMPAIRRVTAWRTHLNESVALAAGN